MTNPQYSEVFPFSPTYPSEREMAEALTPVRQEFLQERYLLEEYIVPDDIGVALEAATEQLSEQEGFVGLVNVGSTANGSLELRRLEGVHLGADLDFYLIGWGGMLDHLRHSSAVVARYARNSGLELDPGLNGSSQEHFFNLDDIEGHIEREELNLLALPFQSHFGDTEVARGAVIATVIEHPDRQDLWDAIANYHIQSLSLQNGRWSTAFNNAILRDYYPKKIEQFELPDTPEEAASLLLGK